VVGTGADSLRLEVVG